MTVLTSARTVSVSDATARGVAGLIKDAERGEDIIVSRHGKPVAAVVSTQHLDALRDLESHLRDAALALVRAATDTGVRGSLDEAITAFGLDRTDLEAELDDDLAAGRE
ncbi:type II toxin-antitoxin system prevent-host-death family antitoxin [Cellulomonas sp. Sa3CUA2]|uniref:Type II toxin-antitoxin system prevent-host-death family antitoxin n=1 Tax=Cellulomonas avistercoris TaxID=2762242 RepID=A0ABR8QG10_9CELL|nr:type II toxin-antitoxin system prevent-host-death family antitoxin [Cellulomonas avistercoris]MBD7919330.1 type II toxin-antitoxin system prevent-host-death family antitoxin [Cellulomonas avistercoris]